MHLIDHVRQLIDAENRGDRRQAAGILADDFVAITRRAGLEENRDDLLKKIGSPPAPNPKRELTQFQIWESASLGVVRSLVRTTDPTTQLVTGEFRNLHVFKREGQTWRCVNWQVTELKGPPVPTSEAEA